MNERELDEHQIAWSEVVSMLLRRRKLILLVFLTGFSLAALYTWLDGPTYRATAVLMVTSARAHIPVSPDANAMPMVEPVTEQDLNSEVAMLKSEALVREVLEPYRDRAERMQPKSGWLTRLLAVPTRVYDHLHAVAPLTAFDKWVRSTAKHIGVTPVAKSDLIQVTYAAGRPEWTAEFVNQLVLHHVERQAQLDHQSEAQQFYERQREVVSRKLGEAEAARREFSAREGVDSVPEQRTALHARIAELQSNLAKSDADLSEGKAREAFLQKELHSSLVALDPHTAQNDPQQLIRTRLIELELQRSQLLVQYAPTSIKVQNVEQQIADARRLLSNESNNPGAVSGVSPHAEELKMELARTQAQNAAVQARVESLRKHLAEYDAQVQHLDQVASEQDRLEQDLTAAKTSFSAYMKKAEEARFSHALDDSHIVNVSIAEPAVVPPAPEPSRRPIVLMLAALLSLALGSGLAYVRDRIDPTVKSAVEAHRITGLPVLADIAS